jgi:hypothetical protein
LQMHSAARDCDWAFNVRFMSDCDLASCFLLLFLFLNCVLYLLQFRNSIRPSSVAGHLLVVHINRSSVFDIAVLLAINRRHF